ncbi:hypothetical protein EW146_g3128 [Bondarzewia mesenterica]|uniref:Ribosome biogenesis regulatory protein n=1 Tax=Bondarzewia mesenterica TaxID=1095465 RepID=A0A4S4M022_9AGAM|nr:hypothetical protein EW146_g3128 [Bondarzewia mesenterica]
MRSCNTEKTRRLHNTVTPEQTIYLHLRQQNNEESYNENLEDFLQSTARDGVQVLLATLFSQPTQSSPDGPLAQLPTSTTQLPRAKPLPKPKPPTKWEKFAAAKGIQKTKRDKKVWDEEKQDWVNRWGWNGKNRELESQWLTEVRANADADHDPSKEARDARKSRVAKNERQQLQNLARAQGPANEREERKRGIEGTLATTRISTASMGWFFFRLCIFLMFTLTTHFLPLMSLFQFDPTETSIEKEKTANLALLSKLGNEHKKSRREDGSDVVNVRKAVRFASKGEGGVSLARKAGGGDVKGKGKGKW